MTTSFAPLWQREAPVDDCAAEVTLVCFSTGALRDDVPFSVGQFGLPSKEAMGLADIRAHRRDENPEWFDGWRNGAAGRVAADHLGAGVALLQQADTCHTVSLAVTSPADFGYLQAAWAIARWLVARGATVVLDAHCCKFIDAETVRAVPPGAPLDVQRELLMVIETDIRAPEVDHILHTRGMRKFGRPDLVALVGLDDAPTVGEVLLQIATAVADGPLPASPRHGVDLADDLTLYMVPDTTQLAERLGLNNEARLLVGEDGSSLRGLAAKLG